MSSTSLEYDNVISKAKALYVKKMKDYGTSWRIMRLPSLTDQIFIKANRIRSIQESGENLVGEDVAGEFVAMINYGIMALIQCELGTKNTDEIDTELAEQLYDKHIKQVKGLMMKKNHDYGEAWREMRVSSMTDVILMKLRRLKQIEDNKGKTIVSEGVEGSYTDIINYSVFCLIQMGMGKEQ
ncbi:MAG: DUF1599 domain-containing protein [Bacteroidota bacterium]|nr:DUF1599 domain-containing protein [Bacteroidota bacterium]